MNMLSLRSARAAAVAVAVALAVAPLGSPATAAARAHGAGHQTGAHVQGGQDAMATAARNEDGSYTVSWSGRGRHLVWASRTAADPSRSGTLVGTGAGSSVTVNGLAEDARWYFEVAPARFARNGERGHHVRGTVVSTRRVGLTSTTNTRDLGGYRTENGRSVRWGLLFRSDAITHPTVGDTRMLAGMGLRHAVDFRGDSEVAKAGANQLDPSVQQHALPLLDDSTTALSDAIQQVLRTGDVEAAEELLGNGKAEQIAATGPTKMMAREITREAFGQLLTLLAEDGGAPLIFNCTAGKDRTGVFAAVLLRVLGVPEQTILDDYELSNVYRAEYNEATYRYLASAGIDVAWIRPLMEQDGENLAAMFSSIEQSYGTFDRFVRDGLGLDRRTVNRLRHAYLVKSPALPGWSH